ncbi:hypothetical protein RJ640_012255 [Escallonia rubra]|uniref:Uncharacterized protein n=1 Tax=Escallonia rubra TaxID=112253 RepID=A0AA88S3N2_9ASTE|nr:hypothetical protein RJ640_012255 [Escallonia rubra]
MAPESKSSVAKAKPSSNQDGSSSKAKVDSSVNKKKPTGGPTKQPVDVKNKTTAPTVAKTEVPSCTIHPFLRFLFDYQLPHRYCSLALSHLFHNPPVKVKAKTTSGMSKTTTTTTTTTTTKKTTAVKTREKKVYTLPGQKFDVPEEREPLRMFYESLSKQIPSSEMAEFW